jgi:hypothetical protein
LNVNGIAGGNAALGRICVAGSNPARRSQTTLRCKWIFSARRDSLAQPCDGHTAVSVADTTKSERADHGHQSGVVVSVHSLRA